MKTLAQIEPRTPISSVPFTISAPGSYYLTTNVTTTVSNAIVIAAGVNDTVILEGLDIEGLGTGLNGIQDLGMKVLGDSKGSIEQAGKKAVGDALDKGLKNLLPSKDKK